VCRVTDKGEAVRKVSKLKKLNSMNIENKKIAIIYLVYVGLPLAVEFGKLYDTVGFDINQGTIDELNLL
jgi:UDP-N-acetyl-D-mannosaminuronate dehydrogenase